MKFDALTHLHEALIGRDIQEALRFIYRKSPEELARPKSEKELELIEVVLNTYDLIGFRLKQGVLPDKATLETEWAILLSIWQQLKPFIETERQRRGNSSYKAHFEWLVQQADDFRQRHHPDFEPRIFVRNFHLDVSKRPNETSQP